MLERKNRAWVMLLCWLPWLGLSGQTIVSTAPSYKRAVLEEFGGMYCVYCPHGHAIIADLEAALGDDLVLLNYQTGSYAVPIGDDPDLRSDYGDAIEAQTQLSGYPAATVNRHVFPGLSQGTPGATAIGRADWTTAVASIVQTPAPVNIAARASLDIATRQLSVYVEYYYTAPGQGSHRLHIGVLQNDVLAPQHGGDAGDYYPHRHLVREFLTGQQGHIINNTQAGSFGTLTYNVELPENYRGVWVDPVQIELAVFITQADQQEVLNGVRSQPTLSSGHAADGNLLALFAPADLCADEINAEVKLRNDGHDALTSCEVHYGIVGGPTHTLLWAGELPPLQATTLALPPLPTLPGLTENVLTVRLAQPNHTNDPTAYNNARNHRFTLAPQVATTTVEVVLRTDGFGYETYWELVDDNDNVYASGGNLVVGETDGGAQIAYPNDPGAYLNNTIVVVPVDLPQDGCYRLRVLDDYADGMCCDYGAGFYRVRLPGEAPFLTGGDFGARSERYFSVGTQVVSAYDPSVAAQPLRVYPNPVGAGQALGIDWPQGTPPATYTWQLVGVDGRRYLRGDAATPPHTAGLAAGYYVLQIAHSGERLAVGVVVE